MTGIFVTLLIVGLFALSLCAAAGKKTPKPESRDQWRGPF